MTSLLWDQNVLYCFFHWPYFSPSQAFIWMLRLAAVRLIVTIFFTMHSFMCISFYSGLKFIFLKWGFPRVNEQAVFHLCLVCSISVPLWRFVTISQYLLILYHLRDVSPILFFKKKNSSWEWLSIYQHFIALKTIRYDLYKWMNCSDIAMPSKLCTKLIHFINNAGQWIWRRVNQMNFHSFKMLRFELNKFAIWTSTSYNTIFYTMLIK